MQSYYEQIDFEEDIGLDITQIQAEEEKLHLVFIPKY